MTEGEFIDDMLDFSNVPKWAGNTKMTRLERIAFVLAVYTTHPVPQPDENVVRRFRAAVAASKRS